MMEIQANEGNTRKIEDTINWSEGEACDFINDEQPVLESGKEEPLEYFTE